MCLILFYPSEVYETIVYRFHSLHASITSTYIFKIKHFWPYTKYNNICLSYKKPGWPRLSSPL